jgi:hypothetical protein
MSEALCGNFPGCRSDVLRQVFRACRIAPRNLLQEWLAGMIVQRWRRSLKTSVIKL